MRRRTLLVVLAVLGAAGMGALWPQPQPSRITRENFALIREGMSRAEVEAILGSSGDYRTRLGESEMRDGSWIPDSADYGRGLVENWTSDSFVIAIAIDDSRGVLGKGGVPQADDAGPARQPHLADQASVAPLVPGVGHADSEAAPGAELAGRSGSRRASTRAGGISEQLARGDTVRSMSELGSSACEFGCASNEIPVPLRTKTAGCHEDSRP